MITGKSKNFKCSPNTMAILDSTNYLSDETIKEEIDEDTLLGKDWPSPADFICFLPWACSQLQLKTSVVITKVYQTGYVSAVAQRTPQQKKEKHLSEESLSKDTIDAHSVPEVDLGNGINIIAVYDNLENLLQIKFFNNQNIPCTLLKLIGSIIQFYPYVNNVTINEGLDKYALYELSKYPYLSHITDMCLDNCIIGEGCFHILLEKENQLRYLSLSRCKINDRIVKNMASKLAYPFPSSKTLMVLNLSINRITDAGAKALADSLRSNRKLNYLSLAGNKLSDDGAAEILNSLSEFALTKEELLACKSRRMQFMYNKVSLIVRTARNLQENGNLLLKQKISIRPNANKKGKVADDMASFDYLKGSQSMTNLRDLFYEKAEGIAEKTTGKFIDPFGKDNIVTQDGIVYSCGNNSLRYLNLAYNNLSCIFLTKLLAVLNYQKIVDKHPRGLVKVVIEGNNMPVTCTELSTINEILEHNIGPITKTRTRSSQRKKRRLRF